MVTGSIWGIAEGVWSSFSSQPMIPALYNSVASVAPEWPRYLVIVLWLIVSIPGLALLGAIYRSTRAGLANPSESITDAVDVAIASIRQVTFLSLRDDEIDLGLVLLVLARRFALGVDEPALAALLDGDLGDQWEWRTQIDRILAELRMANIIQTERIDPAPSWFDMAYTRCTLTDLGSQVIRRLREEGEENGA